MFEECRATCLSEKNRKLIICVQRSRVHGESWGRFECLVWEAEKRQQGKEAEAEVNSVPGSLTGSWHGPRHIV